MWSYSTTWWYSSVLRSKRAVLSPARVGVDVDNLPVARVFEEHAALVIRQHGPVFEFVTAEFMVCQLK